MRQIQPKNHQLEMEILIWGIEIETRKCNSRHINKWKRMCGLYQLTRERMIILRQRSNRCPNCPTEESGNDSSDVDNNSRESEQ